MSSNAPFLKLEAASFHEVGFGSIAEVDLEVNAGELVVVHGPQGAGKAVLVRGCLGFVAAKSGSVSLFGTPLRGLVHEELLTVRRRCALSSASAPLLSNQNVRENLLLPLIMRGVSEKAADARVDEVLALFQLTAAAWVRPEDLLPGDRDLARLARALVVPADLYILDDPSFPLAARKEFFDKIHGGAAALVVVRYPQYFPEATRAIDLGDRSTSG